MTSRFPSRRSRSRSVLVALAVAGVLLAGAGVGAYQIGLFEPAPHDPPGPSAPATADPVLRPPTAAPGQPVLAPAGGAPGPTRAGVRRVLANELADPSLGMHVGVGVVDLTHSRRLLGVDIRSSFVPASVVKLFTAAAALQALGPEHRFETSVLAVPRTRRVVLVGGGDPLLTRSGPSRKTSAPGSQPPASLASLAQRTAEVLQQRGTKRVRLELDAGLFAGPSVSRYWPATFVEYDIVRPVTALTLTDDRPAKPAGTATTDPVAAAGAVFARQLGRLGIDVTSVTERTAPRGTTELASVQSPPLSDIVDEVLALSDNEAAEALLRHVALARGLPATFSGGVRALRAELRPLGVDWDGVRLLDGSGLSYENTVTVTAVLDLLLAAAEPRRPDLRPLLSELPVAGFTGSLTNRFRGRSADDGRGLIRAKTGTLSGVHALAGVVVSRDGTLLGFTLLADGVRLPAAELAERALDRAAAALATCGCR